MNNQFLSAFNRTNVELKYRHLERPDNRGEAFNRTNVELKCVKVE